MSAGSWIGKISRINAFYENFVAGKGPKLALMAPPQHGKSRAAEDFIAWVAGRNPDLKIIYASFSDDLGVRTNLSQQRTIANQRYQLALGNTRIDVNGWICSSDLLEFAGRAGSFRNVTVNRRS